MSENEHSKGTPIAAAGGLLWQNTSQGLKIALVHRSRYDDWTLPKGKLNPRETWAEAALREVKEETGRDVRVLGFAGAIAYETDKGAKIVRFWNMTVNGEGQSSLDTSEVAEVAWLSPPEATERLSYPLEKAIVEAWAPLVKREATGAYDGGRVRGWRGTVRMWWRLELPAYRRLKTELPALEGELKELCPDARDCGWSASVDLLIETAWKYLDHEPEIAWRCYKAAARMMLHAFENDTPVNRAEVISRATAVLYEADEKLGKWRGAAIKKMLTGERSNAEELHRLLIAQRKLDEHHDNLYRKMMVLRKKLRVLQVAGIAAIGLWIVLWPKLAVLSDATPWEFWQPWMARAVALMGATGAIISGFSATKSIDDSRVPLQEAEFSITAARLVFGALAALVVVSFMASGVLDLGKLTVLRALAVAVAAGFSDRLVVKAVNSFAEKDHSKVSIDPT